MRAKLRWKRCPATTSGGKRFFWFAHTPLGVRWVVWDRDRKSWVVQGAGNLHLAEVASPEAGKRRAQDEVDRARQLLRLILVA